MLASDRGIEIPQSLILEKIGAPSTAQQAANALNELSPQGLGRWHGEFVNMEAYPEWFEHLNNSGSWAATLHNPGMGHMVVVERVDNGIVTIRDPYGIGDKLSGRWKPNDLGTRYEMRVEDFLSDYGWRWEALWWK